MKKIYLFFLVYLITSCESSANNNENEQNTQVEIKTGSVTFINESSYGFKVRLYSFDGPVLAELRTLDRSKSVDVRISDDNRFGTIFSIEYLYRISDDFEADSGEVFASVIDPNVQISLVIEEGKSYTVQVPNPKNPEFRTAFIKLLNLYTIPVELRYYGRILTQNNGNLTIPSFKTGIYRLGGIPLEGELSQGYHVVATFESTPVPDFTVKNGFIYTFHYDGNSVTKIGEQSIIFR